MQDLSRFEELVIRHRHDDGTWGEFEEDRDHDAASHDDERAWRTGRHFVCTCGEALDVAPPAEEPAAG